MPDFTLYTNKHLVDYLIEHFHEMDAGDPKTNLAGSLLGGVNRHDVALERRNNAFAIVGRANRKGPLILGLELEVQRESELKFLMVAPEAWSTGLGARLLTEVMDKYMEDQAMTLLCQGDRRKSYFEKFGFVAEGRTAEGLHEMKCPVRVLHNSR